MQAPTVCRAVDVTDLAVMDVHFNIRVPATARVLLWGKGFVLFLKELFNAFLKLVNWRIRLFSGQKAIHTIQMRAPDATRLISAKITRDGDPSSHHPLHCERSLYVCCSHNSPPIVSPNVLLPGGLFACLLAFLALFH